MTAATPPPARPIVSLIAILDRAGGIGKDNRLLVHLSEDLRHFKRTTLGHPVIMGRRTWDSIGKPLPGRRSIVLTRDPAWQADGAETADSFEAALARLTDVDKVYVIGGAQVYASALARADELVLTEIDANFEADTHFPPRRPGDFVETARETHRSDRGFDYSFVTYRRASPAR